MRQEGTILIIFVCFVMMVSCSKSIAGKYSRVINSGLTDDLELKSDGTWALFQNGKMENQGTYEFNGEDVTITWIRADGRTGTQQFKIQGKDLIDKDHGIRFVFNKP